MSAICENCGGVNPDDHLALCYDCETADWDSCPKCENIYEPHEGPGYVLAVVGEGAACPGRGDLDLGIYWVKRHPMYMNGMIEAYFIADALERVAEIPAGYWEDHGYPAEIWCPECSAPFKVAEPTR